MWYASCKLWIITTADEVFILLAVVLVSTLKFIICMQYLQELGALTFLSFKKWRSDVLNCNA